MSADANQMAQFTTEEVDLLEYLVKQAMEHGSRQGSIDMAQYEEILNKLQAHRMIAWQNARR